MATSAGIESGGWRTSTHVFIVWTLLVLAGSLYDGLGPARYGDDGGQLNGLWAGRAALVWVVTLIVLGLYRGVTGRQDMARAAGGPSDLDELRKLGELRDSGVLTADEFEAKKAHILARADR